MFWTAIHKHPETYKKTPNLLDYSQTCAAFSWDTIRDELQGLPDGRGLNIAHEAIDRHAESRLRDHVALRWLGCDGAKRDFTYGELKALSNRFANILKGLGIGKGDTVFVLADRIPELYIAALGTLKNAGVFCPLFSAFGPEPVYQRLKRGDAKVLMTTGHQYRQKVSRIRDTLPKLKYVLLVDTQDHLENGLLSMPRLMAESSSLFSIPPTDPEDIAVLHFTSGTTGMPKGALHVHNAVLIHYMTGKYVMDFHPDDIFWCTADPGWVTGTSYGIIAPWVHGITNIVDEADFDAKRWCHILESQKVSVWYTAPTAIRRFMRLDFEPARSYDLHDLRVIHSVGEPLNPEGVVWGRKAMGLPIHDNWWQTETGGIMIANFPAMEIRPGSMGRPLPGIEAAIVRRTDKDTVEVVDEPDTQGDLALRPGWPSMFRGYLHDEARYRKCFVGGWYLTGDLAKRDADGYFWFVGRADDIIKTSGHMVGPFEVESTLMEHPAVAEAGVIGKPDPLIGEIVKAFVALKTGINPSEELRLEIIGFARKKLGAAVAPKEIDFQPNLPKNKAGKIMRRLLKARELGLPEGDLSTLEKTE
ncbi:MULTISPECIES: acetate--CoA ligase [Desulfococcus]|uniref:acetate--CoA ligase n=1 Tax=Desulfococcus multivorans DSM 2059 TaxID=1121405 RepID=S7VK50_DESML|nr:acetate--CoA ligase [Desulfococcus multivorans]AOY59134.1 AcsA5: acetyl-coenzyme A synthetase (acetate--CoA ligase) [Desulfococcus multivorans]AQV01369.1 acetyl-CoA synthetase [Desulfococcus multivorans]EPR44943.1 AMP-dependent synthetase and ligase [Desulfococcus multivorans DSM 2059]MDX9817985.1 acetate--CoA ligase [Desulfococcus multivorans]SJZ83951.1 acetyl-CoA synthetase [Desulfococcus multivorans DSM 2059]